MALLIEVKIRPADDIVMRSSKVQELSYSLNRNNKERRFYDHS